MNRTILGSFADLAVAGRVVDDLERAGIAKDRLSVVMTRNAWTRYRHAVESRGSLKRSTRPMSGAPWQQMIRASCPGIPGGLMAGGPLAAVLATADHPALAAALETVDVAPRAARLAEAHTKEDAILVAVTVSDPKTAERARGVLDMHSAVFTSSGEERPPFRAW